MKSGFWILILTVGASCLVLLPKPLKTWNIISSFIYAFFRESWRLLAYWLKGARKKITGFVKRLIYTDGRDWLDETENAITE